MSIFTRHYTRIVVLTGAGVSVASGLRPYRGPGGLWEEPDTARFSSTEIFDTDPDAAWQFWSDVRQKCLHAKPNPAHFALADWERLLRSDQTLTLITQNVDGLHQTAGSKNVIELHGSAFRTKCMNQSCSLEPFRDTEVLQRNTTKCPACGSLLRPDVVLFGENLSAEAEWKTKRALRDCDLFIAIGTSGTVSPASRFVESAKYAGAQTILVNLERMSPENPAFDRELPGRAEQIIPKPQFEFALNERMLNRDLVTADKSRQDSARELFDINLNAEEQAARRGHTELLSSFDDFRYADKKLDAWIHRYYQVICSPQYLRLCREKYLTPEEIENIESDDGT